MHITVKGYPATFATSKEKPWKNSLEWQIPDCGTSGKEKGLKVAFRLDTLTPQGQPLDVDNLMEPLLSVLIGKKRWFHGSRPALRWWQATKLEDPRVGCDVEVVDDEEPPRLFNDGTSFLFDDRYQGFLPRDARNEVFAGWVNEHGSKLGRARGFYRVRLVFEGPHHNIGEIATAVVKGTIDCLWPILGGKPGAPQDWRVRTLQVERTSADSLIEAARIQIAQDPVSPLHFLPPQLAPQKSQIRGDRQQR